VLLQEAYNDVTKRNGLGEFMQCMREVNNNTRRKYSVKRSDLESLFSNKIVWEDQAKKGGHIKLKNSVTGVVVEYKNHGSEDVDPGAVIDILDRIQAHINILGNDIFKYTKCLQNSKKVQLFSLKKYS
jgi:predicted RNA binding protein YcfA (HicA-like mRNA interferase family)